MKIKTSELIGPALDWAVAVAEGYSEWDGEAFFRYKGVYCACFLEDWCPSTNWSQGGPILERKGITIRRVHDGTWRADFSEAVLKPDGSAYAYFQKKGPTPLIAANRCYVASQLGDEVDVPEF